jgi:hypothetical protein
MSVGITSFDICVNPIELFEKNEYNKAIGNRLFQIESER